MTESVPLHYTERAPGEPDAPSLLLLHGLYGSSGNLNRFVRRFGERARTVAPDLRNHGRSPHHETMTYPAMAGDVLALMDQLGIERATVLGHSMGGKAAMVLALTHPDRVEALIAADIVPVAYDHGHATVISAMQQVDPAACTSRSEVDQALAQWIDDAGVRQFLLTNLRPADDGNGYAWRIPLHILSRSVQTIEGFPEIEGIYNGPVHFLYGARSDYVIPEQHRAQSVARFPHGRFEAVPDAGHWLHAEQPEAFANAVEAFCDSVWRT